MRSKTHQTRGEKPAQKSGIFRTTGLKTSGPGPKPEKGELEKATN